MNLAYQIKKWDSLYPTSIAIIRILLGAGLVIRGIYFVNNEQLLGNIIGSSKLDIFGSTSVLAMIITWVHLLGGTLIILGLATRIAVWVQIPIILGAVFFINSTGMALTHSDWLLNFFILLLLVLFAIEGGGKISMDHYLKRHEL